MFCVVLDQDPKTGVVLGCQASRYRGEATPSGFHQYFHSRIPLNVGDTYSFIPRDYKVDNFFVRGDLDYRLHGKQTKR